MKKLLMVAALAVSATAFAQSNVEIYGVLDAGIASISGVGATNGHSVQFLNSPMVTSRIGFRGTESLGNDTTAGFNLEQGIATNDGTQGTSGSTGAGSSAFGRAANISIGNTVLGNVKVGRQISPLWQAFIVGDVNGGRNTGGGSVFFQDASSFGGTATAKTGIGNYTGTNFISNAVRYDSPTFAGFRGTAFVTTGGVVNNVTASTRTILVGNFNQGPIAAVAAYEHGKNATGNANSEVGILGGSYTFSGNNKIGAGYTQFKNPGAVGAANSKYDLYQVTGSYDVAPKVVLNGGYFALNDKVTSSNKSKLWSAGADYNVSKRTTLYVAVAHINNDGANGFAAYGAGGANLNSLGGSGQYQSYISAPGQSQTVTVAGLKHSF